jgi:hypothetical protein
VKGKYRIYDENTLLGEFDNVITDDGRAVVGKFLAGKYVSWADAVAIGSGSSAAEVTDGSLEMEFWRDEIDFRKHENSTGKIILRSRIPAPIAGKIFELGVYFTNKKVFSTGSILTSFDDFEESISGGTQNTTQNRIGLSARSLAPDGGTDSVEVEFGGDFGVFTSESLFRLAYASASSISNVDVRLKSSDSDYREYSFTPQSGDYQVESWRLQDFSVVGNPQWNEIYELQVIATGSGSITLDAISVSDEKDDDELNVLVSRALVDFNQQSFFLKKPQRELQIEYILDLSS